MIAVILFFAVGILLGHALRHRSKTIALADSLTMWTIYLLLFVLGLSVGINRQILQHIGSVGFQAAVLAAAAIVGSVLASQLVRLGLGRPADEK